MSSSSVKTSFFFTSISEIIERIRKDHSISGSVDSYYKMASINLDTAIKMINMRLKAFTIDPQNPPKITREYLSRLKKIAKQTGTSIKTFRDYIEILLTRFRRLEFTEDAITIQSDDQSILSLLKDIESKHADINYSFKELKNRSKTREVFEKFINILDSLWSNKLVTEGEKEFRENKSYLIHLFDAKLLKKINLESKIAWTLSDDCKKYFDKIYDQYGLFPSSIIPSIYFSEEIPKIPENKHLLSLENIIKRGEDYGVEFLSLLKDVARNYKRLDEFSKSIQIIKRESINESKINLIREAFSKLIRALVIQSDKPVDGYNDALALYEKSWYEIPEVTMFAKSLKDFNQNIQNTEEDKLALLRDFLSIFKVVISTLKRYVQWDNLFTLKNLNIWSEDKRILNNIRQNLESDNFSLAKGKIINLIKRKLKNLIYNYTVILYGHDKWKRGLPEAVNFKIKKMLERIPSLKISDQKELILRLDLKSLFKTISYLNNEKADNKIQILQEIDTLCKIINEDLEKDNPWKYEICTLIEIIDTFYEKLLNNEIETPWNTHKIESLDGILISKPPKSENIEGIGYGFPLMLDKGLRPINYIKGGIDIRFLACWANLHKINLKISVSYREERILIQKRPYI